MWKLPIDLSLGPFLRRIGSTLTVHLNVTADILVKEEGKRLFMEPKPASGISLKTLNINNRLSRFNARIGMM